MRELRLTGSRWGNGKIRFAKVETINSHGDQTWVIGDGDEVTIRLLVESGGDYPNLVFAADVYRYDGVFIGSVNNLDTNPTQLPVTRGENLIELRIPRLEFSHNVHFLSVKAYTESGEPDWNDPADIHYQMYPFNVLTEGVIHGMMRFEAEWRGGAARETSGARA